MSLPVPRPAVTIATPTEFDLAIYVTEHCFNCEYAREVAAAIRQNFPHVRLRIVDIAAPGADVPEVVFATPTYLLNGRVWSLGNPSDEQIRKTFARIDSEPNLGYTAFQIN